MTEYEPNEGQRMKRKFLWRQNFYAKAQAFFFFILFLSCGLLVFFSTISMLSTILMGIIIFMFLIFFAGLMNIEAKRQREIVEEFVLYYGMLKANEKARQERQKTKVSR